MNITKLLFYILTVNLLGFGIGFAYADEEIPCSRIYLDIHFTRGGASIPLAYIKDDEKVTIGGGSAVERDIKQGHPMIRQIYAVKKYSNPKFTLCITNYPEQPTCYSSITFSTAEYANTPWDIRTDLSNVTVEKTTTTVKTEKGDLICHIDKVTLIPV